MVTEQVEPLISPSSVSEERPWRFVPGTYRCTKTTELTEIYGFKENEYYVFLEQGQNRNNGEMLVSIRDLKREKSSLSFLDIRTLQKLESEGILVQRRGRL